MQNGFIEHVPLAPSRKPTLPPPGNPPVASTAPFHYHSRTSCSATKHPCTLSPILWSGQGIRKVDGFVRNHGSGALFFQRDHAPLTDTFQGASGLFSTLKITLSGCKVAGKSCSSPDACHVGTSSGASDGVLLFMDSLLAAHPWLHNNSGYRIDKTKALR